MTSHVAYVHAHPDDESLWTGTSIAFLAALPYHQVHVLTCTGGEEGEVIPARLKHLELPAGEARPEDIDDPLAQHRHAELAAAVKILGASSELLGYRDSGMLGTPAADHPRAFVNQPVQQVAERLADRFDQLRVDAVVTYDEHGGYGHPDHIRAYQVTRAACRLAAGNPVMWSVVRPWKWVAQDRLWLKQHVQDEPVRELIDDPTYDSWLVPDSDIDRVFEDDPKSMRKQQRALKKHLTQAKVFDGYCTLSNNIQIRLGGREAWKRVEL
jgi:N-acetyl-1-D-myo-inositol-2-amino-2-deoxy-alpha-D-glucopyranoside deacetylase